MQKIKDLYKKYKILVLNTGYLTLLKGVESLTPLLVLPYLSYTLGVESFGLVFFALSFIFYFLLLVDFGFDLSATKEISIHKEDQKKVSEIFFSVFVIRLFFLLFSFCILLLFVFLVPKFSDNAILYIFAFSIVVGRFLFPIYFFQGMGKMQYITLAHFVSKIFFLISILFLIKTPDDFYFVPLLQGLGEVAGGLLSLFCIYRYFSLSFLFPSFSSLKKYFMDSLHIFYSNVSISFYAASNTLFLGIFTNNTVVGYCVGGEKIVRAIQSLLVPFTQALYPHISEKMAKNKKEALSFLGKILLGVGVVTFVISLCVFLFAPLLVDLLLGGEFQESVAVIQILAFLPFVVGISNILGIQTLLPLGFKREFFYIVVCGSILHLILLFFLLPFWHQGVSFAVVITEIFITVTMWLVLKKKRILFF